MLINEVDGMNRTEQLLALLWEQAKRDRNCERNYWLQNAKDPMDDFCQSSKQAGYDISVGELFALGQERQRQPMQKYQWRKSISLMRPLKMLTKILYPLWNE